MGLLDRALNARIPLGGYDYGLGVTVNDVLRPLTDTRGSPDMLPETFSLNELGGLLNVLPKTADVGTLATEQVKAQTTPVDPNEPYGQFKNLIKLFPMGSLLLGGSPAAPRPVPGSTTVGTWVGRNANVDKRPLRRAERMEKAGKSNEEIRQATGWERGFDGEWRHEIPDDQARIITLKDGTEKLHHPRLRTAYPDLIDTLKLERADFDNPRQKGEYDPATNTMRIRRDITDPDEAVAIAIHEITHPIQNREGFSPGTNPDADDIQMVTRQQIEDLENQYLPIIDQWRELFQAYEKAHPGLSRVEVARELGAKHPDLEKKYIDAIQGINQTTNADEVWKRQNENYWRSMGEYEAREAQDRTKLTAEQRKAIPPYSRRLLDPESLIDLRKWRQGGQPPDTSAMVGPGGGMLFDYSRLGEVPDVPQRGLERYIPPRGVSERAQMLDNPRTIRRVEKFVDRGLSEGAAEWYNTEPLRQAFLEELGDLKGQRAFEQYINMVAATSPQSRVPENVRNASFYYHLLRQGLPLPTKPPLPTPYGGKGQNLHVKNAQTVAGRGGWDVMKNPKPASFAENLMGNQRPVTVDTHNMRAWGILSGDEAWVAGRNAEDSSRHPKELLAKGYSLDDLKPTDWTSQPNPNEYGFMEQLQQRRAAKKGISPAQYQSSLWLGAGDITGVGSPPEPFLRTVERRIRLTGERRGLTPEQVLRHFIRGDDPLLSAPGAGIPGLLGAPTDEKARTKEGPWK